MNSSPELRRLYNKRNNRLIHIRHGRESKIKITLPEMFVSENDRTIKNKDVPKLIKNCIRY